MKRAFSLLLALGLLLSLCACDSMDALGSTPQTAPPSPPPRETQSPSDPSQVYRENYDYILQHQSELIALYWQTSGSQIAYSLKGPLEALDGALDKLDPAFFDTAAARLAEDCPEGLLESHLTGSGAASYFSGSSLTGGLRELGDSLLLYLIGKSAENQEDLALKDGLQLCGGDLSYALMETQGTIGEIVGQIELDSGYTAAIPALDWYCDKLSHLRRQSVNDETGFLWNGGNGVQAVRIPWDAIDGRIDALTACKKNWNTARDQWVESFLSDLDIRLDRMTDDDLDRRIYCIFDQAGNRYGLFTALELRHPTFANDGSCVFIEGRTDQRAVFRKISRDGTLQCTYEGTLLGPLSSGGQSGTEGYYPMAPCGTILHLTDASDFDYGSYQSLSLVRPDGTSTEVLKGWDIQPVAYFMDPYHYGASSHASMSYSFGTGSSSDVYQVTYRPAEVDTETLVWIDMTDGTVHTDPEYAAGGSTTNVYPQRSSVSRELMLREDGQLCEKADSETVLADLSGGGGPVRVFWNERDDQYWVISRSGYYYVLNSEFERFREPIPIENGCWDICPFGIILYEESGDMGLYNSRGRRLRTFPAAEVSGFMAQDLNIVTGQTLTLELPGR